MRGVGGPADHEAAAHTLTLRSPDCPTGARIAMMPQDIDRVTPPGIAEGCRP